jgi:three-Cys-motif partner protein
MAEHCYGGPWTDIKLDALESYLGFYARALNNQPFDLWYVDAFAGSGDRTVKQLAGGLFTGQPSHHTEVKLDGSAKRALAINPPFKRLVFIEPHRKRYQALLKLQAAHPARHVDCFCEEGNALVRAICDAEHWRVPVAKGGRRVRAVVLLDPYGMQVKWQTLEAIRKTRAVDLLYLYPIGAVARQAATNLNDVDDAKAAALTRLHGDDSWLRDWYKVSPQRDLLENDPAMVRSATTRQIEAGFKAKLETLFPYVSDPLPLLTTRGAKLFSLYLMVSNDSAAAIALAKKAVATIMRPGRRQATPLR